MKQRSLLSMLMVCIATVAIAATPMVRKHPSAQNGVRLTQRQIETIRAVHPWVGTSEHGTKPKTAPSRLARLSPRKDVRRMPAKVNSSGSSIQGWRSTDEFSGIPSGWHEVDFDGTQSFRWDYHDPDWVDDGWSDEPEFPFTTGFYRNGKVYGFHAEMLLYWLIWGHGTFTLDGETVDYVQYGDYLDVTDFSTYVITCAYDSDRDIAYAYTLNEDASAYMLRSVNPDTWTFSTIRPDVPIEEVLVGFSYNPADSRLYGITPDSRFVTLDPATGELSQIAKLPLPVSTSSQGMTYSPYDKAFAVIIPSDNISCDLYTIDPTNPQLVKRAVLEDAYQYRILITPDRIVDGATPLTAEIQAIDFSGGATDGKATVKLPVRTFDGSVITDRLTVTAFVDGRKLTSAPGNPGDIIEIPLSGIEEGMRGFSFTVKGNGLESAETVRKLYVGFDTPTAPLNIRLQAGTLQWDPVATTVNGGYLDAEALTYNVYLNGEKINRNPVKECAYSFSMPEDVFQKYVAQVEADNHGHVSERGFSNDIKEGHAFPLPFSMEPTRTEADLVSVESGRHEMLTWRGIFDEWTAENTFTCNTFSYDDPVDEWLWLPAIDITEMGHLLEISFDMMAYHYYDEDIENIGVGVSPTQNSANATVVKKWENLTNDDWVRLTAYCLPEAGTSYIGFYTRLHPEGHNVQIRNITIKESQLPTTIPAAVAGLTAEPLPLGVLKATVAFTMPTMDAAGKPLADTELSATVSTEAETLTLKSHPGEQVATEITTTEGYNTITVIAANSADGLEATTQVFTGIDVPTVISDIKASHTADYKGLHLEWKDPTAGANGGFVDPSDITYSIYFYNEDEYEWQFAGDLGGANSCDIGVNVPEGIQIVEIGILAENSKGNCGTLRVVGAAAGTPYDIPMQETFGIYEHAYEPMVMEFPTEEYVDGWWFGNSYPNFVDLPSPYGEYSYIMSASQGEKGRVTLPAFSTKDIAAAGIELPLYATEGENEIRVYARTFGTEPMLLGVYEGTTEPAWTKVRFHLPSELIGKEWVEILIDGVFTSEYESTASFGQYKIQTFADQDMAVNQVLAPAFGFVGEKAEVSATVENQGLNGMTAPSLRLVATKGDDILASIDMERIEGADILPELGEATYKTTWIPDTEALGDLTLSVTIVQPDMIQANNRMEACLTVGLGNAITVTDLQATQAESAVVLTWTDPVMESGFEGFETQAPYYYGDSIGSFKTVCRDEYESLYFIFEFPFGQERKAWQVMSESHATARMEAEGWDNTLFTAYTGDRFLMAVAPLSFYVGEDLEADRWLISPEVKGGSDISFMLGALSGRVEPFEVLYSSTDDNPDSFILMESNSVLSDVWKKYEYTLPEDAMYFAIRYTGNSSDHQYILIDDISFDPAKAAPSLQGYDIYRNGVLIAEGVKTFGSYVDNDPSGSYSSYKVQPVVNEEGTVRRGILSNTAYIGTSGVVAVEDTAEADAEYFTLQGLRVTSPPDGIYIKRKANQTSKVKVK